MLPKSGVAPQRHRTRCPGPGSAASGESPGAPDSPGEPVPVLRAPTALSPFVKQEGRNISERINGIFSKEWGEKRVGAGQGGAGGACRHGGTGGQKLPVLALLSLSGERQNLGAEAAWPVVPGRAPARAGQRREPGLAASFLPGADEESRSRPAGTQTSAWSGRRIGAAGVWGGSGVVSDVRDEAGENERERGTGEWAGVDPPLPSGRQLFPAASPYGDPGSMERAGAWAQPDRLPPGLPEPPPVPPRGTRPFARSSSSSLTWAPREGAKLRCLLRAGADPLQQHRGLRGHAGRRPRCAGGCGGVAERRGGERRERRGGGAGPGRGVGWVGGSERGRAGGGTAPSGRAAAGPQFTAGLFSITKAGEWSGGTVTVCACVCASPLSHA